MEAVAKKRQMGPNQIKMLSQDIVSHQNKAALGFLATTDPISNPSLEDSQAMNSENYLGA
jgi:hypothetical protein